MNKDNEAWLRSLRREREQMNADRARYEKQRIRDRVAEVQTAEPGLSQKEAESRAADDLRDRHEREDRVWSARKEGVLAAVEKNKRGGERQR